jgi:hypothetical protein
MNPLPRINQPTVIKIDCDNCQVRHIECSDCVVAALIGAPTELSNSDLASISVLSKSGLVSPLRLVLDSSDKAKE